MPGELHPAAAAGAVLIEAGGRIEAERQGPAAEGLGDGDDLLRVLWGGAEFSIRLPRYKGDLVPPASPGSGTAKEQELLAGEVQNRLNETSPRVVLET